eukprot:CAMPEP_0172946082 /NCGR_PEP_ID=MMETSP1075-20121228/226882_1 /TAXON_ID=2916 /ORGANISM="Ceratium fusus, Strain PA161109" /LENGTH=169 /DNA_ID=CAMNT_0013807533 /DNA_START=417 /DNA_END=928 /DNA_ORIENTATION=-
MKAGLRSTSSTKPVHKDAAACASVAAATVMDAELAAAAAAAAMQCLSRDMKGLRPSNGFRGGGIPHVFVERNAGIVAVEERVALRKVLPQMPWQLGCPALAETGMVLVDKVLLASPILSIAALGRRGHRQRATVSADVKGATPLAIEKEPFSALVCNCATCSNVRRRRP